MKQIRQAKKPFGDGACAENGYFGECEKGIGFYKLALRPVEVADALGINVKSVYCLIHAQRLPAVRIGNGYIVPVRALESALNDLIGQEVSV